MSPPVASEKDSKEPEWEMDCVTYQLKGNMLTVFSDKDLWKMVPEKEPSFMSFYVRASNSENGTLAARQSFGNGADLNLRKWINYNTL
jgi:hypothetical protein